MSKSSVPAKPDALLDRVNGAANAFLETASTGAATIQKVNESYTSILEGIDVRVGEHYNRAETSLENIGNAARYPTVVRNVLGLLGFDEFNTDLQRSRYQGATLNIQQLEQRAQLAARLRESAVSSITSTVEAARLRATTEAEVLNRSLAVRADSRAERADARAEADSGRAATRFSWEEGEQKFRLAARSVGTMSTEQLGAAIKAGPTDQNRDLFGLMEEEYTRRAQSLETLETSRLANIGGNKTLSDKLRSDFLTRAPASVLKEILDGMKESGQNVIERDGIRFTSREIASQLAVATENEDKLLTQIYGQTTELMQLGSRQTNIQRTAETLTTIPNAVTPGFLDVIEGGNRLFSVAAGVSPRAAAVVLEKTESAIAEHIGVVAQQFSPSKEVQQEVVGYMKNGGVPVATTALLAETITNPIAMEGTPYAAAWRAVSDAFSTRQLQSTTLNISSLGSSGVIPTGKPKTEEILRETLRAPQKVKIGDVEFTEPAAALIARSMYNDYGLQVFASLAKTNPAFGQAISQVRNDVLSQAFAGNGKVALSPRAIVEQLAAVDKAIAIQHMAQVADAAVKKLPPPPAPPGLTELYARELVNASNVKAFGVQQFANADINQRFFGTASGFYANGQISAGGMNYLSQLNSTMVTEVIRPTVAGVQLPGFERFTGGLATGIVDAMRSVTIGGPSKLPTSTTTPRTFQFPSELRLPSDPRGPALRITP